MSVVAVIPARWGSRRFPGKPLAPVLGRPMITWVVEAALAARRVHRTMVATDDERIADAARAAGAEVRMTRPEHRTGTDRVCEAIREVPADVVLNLQGDEPALLPTSVDRLVSAFDDVKVRMATLGVRGVTEDDRRNPALAKIVVDSQRDALYFSRAPIPYRNVDAGATVLGEGDTEPECWRHVGTYGFRREALERFVQEPRTGLEELEDLEQLRALRLGWKVRVVEVVEAAVCVDAPEDVGRVERLLTSRSEGVAG